MPLGFYGRSLSASNDVTPNHPTPKRQRTDQRNENQSPRLIGRRRLPAMELQLPQLRRRAQRHAKSARPAPNRRSRSAITPHDWLLVNASPDILAQIAATPNCSRRAAARDTGIAAVLTDRRADRSRHRPAHAARTRHAAAALVTDPVWQDLTTGFPIRRSCSHYCGVERHRIALDGKAITVAAVPRPAHRRAAAASKAPPYSPHRDAPVPGDNIGLLIDDTASERTRVLRAGPRRDRAARVRAPCANADCVLVDGTLWTDDEMIRARPLEEDRARDMGHLRAIRRGRHDRVLDSLPAERAQGAHPHQQHESDPRRGRPRARAC